jgi:hypothetical protein
MGRYDVVRSLEGHAMMYRHDKHRQDRASHIPGASLYKIPQHSIVTLSLVYPSKAFHAPSLKWNIKRAKDAWSQIQSLDKIQCGPSDNHIRRRRRIRLDS